MRKYTRRYMIQRDGQRLTGCGQWHNLSFSANSTRRLQFQPIPHQYVFDLTTCGKVSLVFEQELCDTRPPLQAQALNDPTRPVTDRSSYRRCTDLRKLNKALANFLAQFESK
eukprot:760812-Hanusia_phi.AAC.3